jgi:DNA-binding transcriptional LysR family regulator
VKEAERDVSGEYRVTKGEMTVAAPWGLDHTHLLPQVIEFLDAYPDISVRLKLTDSVVNMTDENIDVAIRLGPLPESSMIATRAVRIVVCASPSYLKTRGRPRKLSDLTKHDCITIDDHAVPGAWKFVRGNRIQVAPIPRKARSSPPSTAPAWPE